MPQTRPWRIAAGLIGFGLIVPGAAQAAPPAATTVVVTGTGADEREAVSSALRGAIGRVVGVFVASDFIVRDDVVVRDELLEHRAGFVRTYTVLDTSRPPDGGVRVTVRATVVPTAAPARGRTVGTAVAVSPDDLRAAAETRAEARRTAAALLARLFADLPTIARAEPLGRPTPARDGSGIHVVVRVRVDDHAYADWLRRAVRVLGHVAGAPNTLVVPAERTGPDLWRVPDPFRGRFVAGPTDTDSWVIGLLTDRDRGWARTRWRTYRFDADRVPVCRGLTLRLDARDAAGDRIAGTDLPLGGTAGTWFLVGGGPGIVLVAPVASDLGAPTAVGATGGSFAPAVRIRAHIPLSASQRDRLAFVTTAVTAAAHGDAVTNSSTPCREFP